MKIRVLFKTTDAKSQLDDLMDYEGEPDPEETREIAREVFDKYVAWGENLTVEIDTEARTLTAHPIRRT